MGEAYTAVSEDAYSTYWNPAGLASVEAPSLAATYNASFEDVTHQYIAGVYPLRFGSVAGITISRLGVGAFQGYDAQGLKTSSVESSDLAVGGVYGRTIYKDEIERPLLNVGAGVKLIREKLDTVSANTAALDLGAVYYIRPARYWVEKIQAQEFRIGFALRNLGPGLTFDRETAQLPLSATLGGAWLSHPGGNSSFVLSLDQTVSRGEGYYAAIGADYCAFQLVSFRAGYRTGQDIGSGVRFGLGLKLSVAEVDYSMSPFGELGAMHKIGVSMRLGQAVARQPLAGRTGRVGKAKLIAPKERIEQLGIFARDFLALAEKDLAARRYVSALENIGRAFNLEPELKAGDWGWKEKRLSGIVEGLRLEGEPERERRLAESGTQADLGSEAIMAYIGGSNLKALLLAHAAWGTDMRSGPLYEELLNLLGRLTDMKVRPAEILSFEALVKEKLRKAAEGFYARKFDSAARECEEASLLDEKNPYVWTRLGSAYFMMGDTGRARSAYQKALELNPEDQITRKFMEMQGWLR